MMKAEIESEAGDVREILRERISVRVREALPKFEEAIMRAIEKHLEATAKLIAIELKLDILGSSSHHEAFQNIASYVCARFHVAEEYLAARSNRMGHAGPRAVAMHLCRKLTGAPFAEVGRFFKRGHGTVMAACKKVADRRSTNAVFDQFVAEMELALGERESAFRKAA
jgi:chromosomal replication initiation ATPase DnaA